MASVIRDRDYMHEIRTGYRYLKLACEFDVLVEGPQDHDKAEFNITLDAI